MNQLELRPGLADVPVAVQYLGGPPETPDVGQLYENPDWER